MNWSVVVCELYSVTECHTDPYYLFCACETMFLKVLGQVEEGVSVQVLTITEGDQQALLLNTHTQTHTEVKNGLKPTE